MAHKMILVSPDRYRQWSAPEKEEDEEEEEGGDKGVTEVPITHHSDVTEKAPLEIDVILSDIPKNFRNRAKSLLNHITADPQQRLRWNGTGEIIYNGLVVSGSRISELLNNSQRRYKHLKPIGQHEFREGIRELNIPLGLLESGPPGIPNIFETKTWLAV